MIFRWQTENLLKAEPTPSFLLVTNLDPLSLHTNLDEKKRSKEAPPYSTSLCSLF